MTFDKNTCSKELLEYIVNLNGKRTRLLLKDEEKRMKLKLQHWERIKTYLDEKVIAATTKHRLVIPKAIRPEGSVNNEELEVSTSHSTSQNQNDIDTLNIALAPLCKQCDDARTAWKQISNKLIPTLIPIKTTLQSNKRIVLQQLAQECQAIVQAYNGGSARVVQKSKKLAKEAILFWKKHEKEEREMRKRAKKEAMERLRAEEEEREKKRQAKKLQFLLTQTELYSHFVGKKLNKEEFPVAETLSKRNENVEHVDFADIKDEDLNEIAREKAQAALLEQQKKMASFDENKQQKIDEPAVVKQPKMLTCQLKPYQLKGLTWLANLYEQGINGILADDMGLGKTVQSISLLAHLAETHNIWGPFLVVSPASTLHNWQQEFAKFTPQLKAIPCWGSVKERKTLRKYWSGNRIYTKDSPAHVIITSYQIVVSDQQYFQRVKWQYMVLDEAHAIKSANTARWKTLLNFNCRNRLLLTGTPIQNSMTELWALLHFIMPTIFDSHEEFSEWFSKDIETHAVDKEKGKLNERQLKRLHAILKPFMLRRIKSDVEHELGQKIEKTVYCQLTPRQKRMYNALDNTGIDELLERLEQDESLMNQVMQFRKVCNHPQLFEQTEVSSPFFVALQPRALGGNKARLYDDYVVYNTRSLIGFQVPRLIWFELIQRSQGQSIIWSFDQLRYLQLHYSKTELNTVLFKNPVYSWFSEIERRKSISLLEEYDKKSLSVPLDFIVEQSSAPLNVLDTLKSLYKRLPAWYFPHAEAPPADVWCSSSSFKTHVESFLFNHHSINFIFGLETMKSSDPILNELSSKRYHNIDSDRGFTHINVPNARQLLFESGKLQELDNLLAKLKAEDHRVLIYFQMTKMIDLFEEYLTFRQYSYLRLDGSTTIADRRDLVSDWQTRPELFIFLLSTRAGGLGINLTAADTVIFYDSDWNPTVDQQAMDRAHRLGQTRQVTVYRLVTSGTIEERILQRAMQKDEIQKVVIAKGTFDQNTQ